MRTLHMMAACTALALMAPPNDQGAAQAAAKKAEEDAAAAAAKKAEEDAAAAAAAKKAEEDAAAAAAARKAEEDAAAAAAAKKAEEDAAAAAAAKKTVVMVWVQPGHERYFIGQAVEFPASDAEFLRAAGRAREATKAEIKAYKDAKKAAE